MMIKKTIIFLFAIAMITACDNNDEFVVDQSSTQNKVSRSCMDLPYWVEDGILNFRSANDFFQYSDSIANLSQDEFESFEAKLGFNSYRTLVNAMIDQIEDAEDNLPLYNQLLFEYADHVRKNGDFVKPIIEIGFYRSLINKNREFCVEGVKHIVDENNIYITYKNQTRSASKAIPYLNKPLTKANEILYPEIWLTYDKRQVYTSSKIFLKIVGTPFVDNNVFYQNAAFINSGAKKKKPVKYKFYDAYLYMQDVYIKMNNVPMKVTSDLHTLELGTDLVDKKGVHEESVPSKPWDRTFTLGVPVRNAIDINHPEIFSYRIWSSGTVGHYIDYKIVNGEYKGSKTD